MEIWIPPGIGFLKDFDRFGTEIQRKLAPEIQQNLTQIWKVGTCKKPCFSIEKQGFLQVTGIENKVKNQ